MSTLHTFNENKAMLTKGGPDVMFARCSYVFLDGEEKPMTEEILAKLKETNEEFFESGAPGPCLRLQTDAC